MSGVVLSEMEGVFSSPDQLNGILIQQVKLAGSSRVGAWFETSCAEAPCCFVFGLQWRGGHASARKKPCLLQGLFRDHAYRFVSGGDPQHIPNLTFDALLVSMLAAQRCCFCWHICRVTRHIW